MDRLSYFFSRCLNSNCGPSVFIIYGPTATGKTAISVELSILYNAEVVNCDMAQIFAEAKIATGQVNDEEKCGIPHHLFGFLEAPSIISVYQMRSFIEEKIKEIFSRHKNVILVGGSGFCILSLFFIPSAIYLSYPREVINSQMPISEIIARDIFTSSSSNSRDDIVYFPFFSYTLIYLDIEERGEWASLVKKRIDGFFKKGLLNEISSMSEEWRRFFLKKKIIGYHELVHYFYECEGSDLFFSDNASLLQKKELMFFATCQYGKRQRTFMRKIKRHLLARAIPSFSHFVKLDDLHY
jgi:tRNA A37 N6-isopentenylltransferase MiaA